MLKKDSLGKEKVRKTPEYTAKTHWASITKFGRIYSAPFLFVLLPVIVLFALKADVSIAGWLSSLVNMQINRFVVLAAIAVILWQVVVCWCIWLPCLIKFKATPLHHYSFYNDIMEHSKKPTKNKDLPKFYKVLQFLINLVPTIIAIILIIVLIVINLPPEGPDLGDPTVTFDTRGGSEIPSVVVKVGDTVDKPTDPTKENCSFMGWYQDETLIYAWDFEEDVVVADITLYAKWEKEEALVRFDTRGGSSIANVRVKGGSTVNRPADPTKENCTFDAWYRDPGFTTLWNFDTDVVHDDTTLYAKWKKDVVTVKFNTLGGSNIPSVTVKGGNTIDKPEDPTKDDCTFEGWYKDSSCLIKWNFSKDVVTDDIILYAKWEAAPVKNNPTIYIVIAVIAVLLILMLLLGKKDNSSKDFSERTINARSILAFTETEKRFADPKVVLPETTPEFIKRHVFRHAINYNFGDVIIRSPKGMNDDIVLNNIEDPDKLMNYLDSIRKRPSEVASYNSNH